MAENFESLEDELNSSPNLLIQRDTRRRSNDSSQCRSHFGDKTVAVAREQVLDIVRSNKVVDEMAKKLFENNLTVMKPAYIATKCRLQIDVVSGRAFVDFIVSSNAVAESSERVDAASASTLTCCVLVEGQRSRTRPTPCKCEPQFGDTLYFHLNQGAEVLEADWLNGRSPVTINMINTNFDGSQSLLSTTGFDWREILAMDERRATVALELPRAGVVVGILDLRIRVHLPDIDVPSSPIVKEKIESNRALRIKLIHRFVQYAKKWWREYLDIRPSHADRLVKMFARGVGGEHRMVSTFIQPPVECCRVLDTARRALRFVALLRVPQSMSKSQDDTWKTPVALLDSGNGHQEDRSVLLCSLLIGLGLVAYVSLGSDDRGRGCAWVVTFRSVFGDVTFWDALHGERYRICGTAQDLQYPYRTIDCLFNDQSFHANCQASNEISTCDFDVTNGTLWKSMSSEHIKSTNRLTTDSLKWSLIFGDDTDTVRMSRELEATLKSLVAQHRTNKNLDTNWNDQMGIVLGPALAVYENEKQTGLVGETGDFLEAVQHLVPDGHTFKGFPNNSRQADGPLIFRQCLKSDIFKDILSSRGDEIQFSVHSKVYVFPENLLSVWTMLAVTYLPIP